MYKAFDMLDVRLFDLMGEQNPKQFAENKHFHPVAFENCLKLYRLVKTRYESPEWESWDEPFKKYQQRLQEETR